MSKQCKKCNEVKEISCFDLDNRRDDKLCVYCKSCKSAYQKEWNRKNRETRRKHNKSWRDKNKEHIKEYHNSWRKQNLEYYREYVKRRYSEETLYKLTIISRSNIKRYIKNKKCSSSDIIGCSPLELKIHLENQFKDGMTWDNHGEWHIDHVVPLSSANTEDELISLNHYTNLQPLWAFENMSKGSKVL